MMRPSEVAALTREGCHLPGSGWGHLIFADSSPAAGRAYIDDGQVHEHRGPKGRTKGRPNPTARRPVRKVPIPPELVQLLRAHLEQFGTAPDGRLFHSESGNPLQPSTWWQVLPDTENADVGGVHDADGESGNSGGVVGEVPRYVGTVPG